MIVFTRERQFLFLELLNGEDLCHPQVHSSSFLFLIDLSRSFNSTLLGTSFPIVPKIPDPPDIYAKVHPDRVETFPSSVKKLIVNPRNLVNESQDDKWRHELEHDAESVFWLLLYWAMVMQPEGYIKDTIDAGSWGQSNGDHKSRQLLIVGASDPGTMADNLTHSFYEPLRPLISDLAAILVVDGHWLPASDPRKDPYYVTKAFQRLILNFIENRGEEFMDHPVEKTFREVRGA